MSLLNKRFPTVLGLLLLVVAVLGAFYYLRAQSSVVAEEVVPQNVRITNLADNKFSVSWTTLIPTSGAVEYGPIGEKLGTTVSDQRDAQQAEGEYVTHHVNVEGLQPSTQYAFRIISGKGNRFDNNGSPYVATTGVVIGETPSSHNLYGDVKAITDEPVEGSLVYLTLPGSGTASTIVSDSGSYAFTLSTIRTSDGRTYVSYDPAATIANIIVDSGIEQSNVVVSLTNMSPVPTITLGEDADFLTEGEESSVAVVAEEATVLNVEPLTDGSVNAVTGMAFAILNPATEGEALSTLRPEFRGTGAKGTTITIALTGQKAISDTVTIESDGTWSWAPVIDLKTGKQTITVSYIGAGGTEQKLTRTFTISTAVVNNDPAFISSPSGSTTVSKTPIPTTTAREGMPATDAGVPVTGVIENTVLTAGLGIVIMVLGVMLFAL